MPFNFLFIKEIFFQWEIRKGILKNYERRFIHFQKCQKIIRSVEGLEKGYYIYIISVPGEYL